MWEKYHPKNARLRTQLDLFFNIAYTSTSNTPIHDKSTPQKALVSPKLPLKHAWTKREAVWCGAKER